MSGKEYYKNEMRKQKKHERLEWIKEKLFLLIVVPLIFLIGWIITAYFYPDEWFSDIPRLILSIIGIDI
jgi:hypothetical protein